MESTPPSPTTYDCDYVTTPTAVNRNSGFSKSSSRTSDDRHRDSGPKLDLERTIPPSNERRTLVLCFDGTGDQFDDDNSNVINFFTMLKKDDKRQQLVYYQAGIGTYTVPQIARPLLAKFHRTIDAMLGSHLNAHVMGGYEFLMQNYQNGDKICLFGFSRGAYTARALAGMLHKVGLLPKCNHQQVPFAYKMYSREDEAGWRQSTAFKRAFSIDVDIELLGVWDTVSSVGFIPKRLPFTRSNTNVRYFRHAVALDEHRARFQPNFWNRPTPDEQLLGFGDEVEMPKSSKRDTPSRKKTLEQHEREDSETDVSEGPQIITDIEEVWFAGCHCDVGGGALPNSEPHSLARIPLRWMIRQCFLLDTGILFHADMMRLVGIDHATLYPHVLPRPPPLPMGDNGATRINGNSGKVKKGKPLKGQSRFRSLVHAHQNFKSEEEEDLHDALTGINDQLKDAKLWWILEVLPQQLRFQDDKDTWIKKFQVHWGKGRHIPRQSTHGVKIHRTVQMRMEALGYKPKANLKPTTEPTWVD